MPVALLMGLAMNAVGQGQPTGAATPCVKSRIYSRKRDLPIGAEKSLGARMAEAGQPFRVTDAGPVSNLPDLRFVSARQSHCTITLRYEKGGKDAALTHIDYGAIALRRSVIAEKPSDTVFGLDAIQHELAKAHRLRAYEAQERFYEVGSELGISDLEKKLAGV